MNDEVEKEIVDNDKPDELLEAVTAFHDFPTADEGVTWDEGQVREHIAKWASSDGSGDKDKINWAKYAQCFMWYDSANQENITAYKFPYADIRDGAPVVVWNGIRAIMSRLPNSNIPDADKDKIRAHCLKYYKKFNKEPPDDDMDETRDMDNSVNKPDDAELVDSQQSNEDPGSEKSEETKEAKQSHTITEMEIIDAIASSEDPLAVEGVKVASKLLGLNSRTITQTAEDRILSLRRKSIEESIKPSEQIGRFESSMVAFEESEATKANPKVIAKIGPLGKKNMNGYIYTANAVNNGIEKAKRRGDFVAGRNVALDGHSMQNYSSNQIAAKWDDIKVVGDMIEFYGELMPTTAGKTIKMLYDQGVKLGISTRGFGSIDPDNPEMINEKTYDLTGADFVIEPAFTSQYLMIESRLKEVTNEMSEEINTEATEATEGEASTETREDTKQIEEGRNDSGTVLDPEVQRIIVSDALSRRVESTMREWETAGLVTDTTRSVVHKTLEGAKDFKELDARIENVKPFIEQLAGQSGKGKGVVQSSKSSDSDFPDLNSVEDVVNFYTERVPEEKGREEFKDLIENWRPSEKRQYLWCHTNEGRNRFLNDVSVSSDMVYAPFVLPIVYRMWLDLTILDLVQSVPVRSPSGFIPRIGTVEDAGGQYISDYVYNAFQTYDEGTTKPSVSLKMDQLNYAVEDIAVAFSWTEQLAQDMESVFRINVENLLVNDTARRLTTEVNLWVLAAINAAATASGNAVTFGSIAPSEVDHDKWITTGFQSHVMSLASQIVTESNQPPQWILCGPTAYIYFGIPNYMQSRPYDANSAIYGIQYMGTFAGSYNVYMSPFMDTNTVIMGSKGNSLASAGVLFLPYILGVVSERSFTATTNTFSRSIMSRADTVRMKDTIYGKLTVSAEAGSWPI